MNHLPVFFRWRRLWVGIIFVAIVVAILWPWVAWWRGAYGRSAVWVESRTCYCLTAAGLDTLYFWGYEAADSAFARMALTADAVDTVVRSNGFWYRPLRGIGRVRVLTAGRVAATWADTLTAQWNDAPGVMMAHQVRACRAQLARLEHEEKEYRYYIRTHSVQDEGYTLIAGHFSRLKLRHDTLTRLLNKLQRYARLAADSTLTLHRFTRYAVWPMAADGRIAERPVACAWGGYHQSNDAAWLVPLGAFPTKGVYAAAGGLVGWWPWWRILRHDAKSIAVAYNRSAEMGLTGPTAPDRIEGRLTVSRQNMIHNFPTLSGADGAPVYLPGGYLVGMISGNHVIPVDDLNAMLRRAE